jgi:PqqD family protein of HPr-rel-A system
MTLLRQADRVFTAPVDDVFLMINADKGRYHSLNEVAARIWELLKTPTSEDGLIEALTTEYDISREACAAEVSAFLAALRQRGLVTESD